MTDSINVRELALDMLLAVTRENKPSHVVHSQMLEKYQYLEKQERKFLSRLFKGTLERMLTLDYVIGQFSTVKTSKIKPVLKNILRLSVYQMLYMSQIPDSAACNEAVKLAGRRGFKNLKGFVNGVLRNVSRNKEKLSWPDAKKQPIAYLSVMYSAPEWLVRLWVEAYGIDTARAMLEDSLADKPVTVRCMDEDNVPAVKKVLEAEGVTVAPGSLLPYALQLSGFNYMNELESFRSGLYTVQDESSMMVVEMAGLHAGDTVIDVCAAPGGKSCHAAGRLAALEKKAAGNDRDAAGCCAMPAAAAAEGEPARGCPGAPGGCGAGNVLKAAAGHVFARDLTPQKAELIEENCRRLGLDNVSVQVWDACVPNPADAGRAQVVLADLPCSGLGVIGRKADIKYRMGPEQMAQLAALQRQILSVVQNYVAPGGTLVYSTCTVNPAENIDNARWFEKNFDFTMAKARQFLPGVDGCDGFFIAKFTRREP